VVAPCPDGASVSTWVVLARRDADLDVG